MTTELEEVRLEVGITSAGELFLSEGNYSIALPNSIQGYRYLISILSARQMKQTKIGQAGAPTQWEIDKAIRDFKPVKPLIPSKVLNLNIKVDL